MQQKLILLKEMLYNAKIKNIKDKICNVTNFATDTTLNAKISEVKSEIVSITNLATNSLLKAKYLVLLTQLLMLLLPLLKIK